MSVKENGGAVDVSHHLVGSLVPGSRKGVPNKDKEQLRVLVQESVHEFTQLRRDEIRSQWRLGWRPSPDLPNLLSLPPEEERVLGEEVPDEVLDSLQPEEQEYDPVVALAVMAADRRHDPSLRMQASASAAQYMRPKLKSVEIVDDAETKEIAAEKNELVARMLSLLDVMAIAKLRGTDAEPHRLEELR